MNILRQYRNKAITRKTAVALVTKFLLQEGVLFKFLDDIKKIKPYKKGNDDMKYLMSYAVTLALNYDSFLTNVFVLPIECHENLKEREFWFNLNDKWLSIVGERLCILPI